jgi:CRP-like cAMP-binding protein
MSITNPIIARFEALVVLDETERDAIANLPLHVMQIRADQDLVREGDRPSRSCVLLEGVAYLYKSIPTGGRQIMGFYLPGDIPDLQSLHLRVLDVSIGTISACRVGFIPHEALTAFCETHPRIAALLWRQTLVEAAIFREWMVNIGRRDGLTRLAHFLCEWITRCRSHGLGEGDSVPFPITQGELADIAGLTPVHINRLLQELRRRELILLKNATLTVLNWEKLKEAGQFNPTYLHLTDGKHSGI